MEYDDRVIEAGSCIAGSEGLLRQAAEIANISNGMKLRNGIRRNVILKS